MADLGGTFREVPDRTADHLLSAVESMQDAFALFDSRDRLIVCNGVFRRLVHAAHPGTLIGMPYAEVLDAWIDDIEFVDDDAKQRFRAQRLARRRSVDGISFDVRIRDGRTLRVTDRRTDENGSVKTIWDITDEVRQAAELREARGVAEAASAAKSEFLSSMSHELRTPLNAVLGFAQLLLRDRKEPISARHRERVEHVIAGGEHLLRLIDDVLDLSKIDAGQVSLDLEPVDVAAVIDEVTSILESLATRQQIALLREALPASLPAVFADRTRFAQILMNFGSNAIKYNRAGGSVRLVVSAASSHVRVSIIDAGIGIPADKQSTLFHPFQRAGQEAGTIEGTGIGLVITKRLAELMGGSVGFSSVDGEGSVFWVQLPTVDRDTPSEPVPIEVRVVPAVWVRGERHLVLCVEDSRANIVFMRDLMSTLEGIELVIVPTAELGIALARARKPHLVLMDLNLPGMSGLDALRTLRCDDDTKNIPMIALTAAASERDRQRGLDAGFYRYLSKPANVDELIDAIQSALHTPDGVITTRSDAGRRAAVARRSLCGCRKLA